MRSFDASRGRLSDVGVVQVVDTLEYGGLERVAVTLANELAARGVRSHLCATRKGGSQRPAVSRDVGLQILGRKRSTSLAPLLGFVQFLRRNRIQVVHAHGTAIFFAGAACALHRSAALIWHDHYGRFESERRSRLPYWMVGHRIDGVLSVSEALAEWARRTLPVKGQMIRYMPNFILSSAGESERGVLPGDPEWRVVCVANYREQKNHLTLLEAMRSVVEAVPRAHLLLIGAPIDVSYRTRVHERIFALGLQASVTDLGEREDVPAVLKACAVGVLSSNSEGLPLALLEYGLAGLGVLTTAVGECPDIVKNGECGLVVEPGNTKELADGIVRLLQDPAVRSKFGNNLRTRVEGQHGAARVVPRILDFYGEVLRTRPARGDEKPPAANRQDT